MQPKPIDSRSVLDVDRQRRIVDMKGFAEHLRALREHKENPEETDYDVSHDEENRHEGEETSKQPAENLKQVNPSDEQNESASKDSPKDKPAPAKGEKGTRLDLEA
jgi:Ulp1 family protease